MVVSNLQLIYAGHFRFLQTESIHTSYGSQRGYEVFDRYVESGWNLPVSGVPINANHKTILVAEKN